MPGSYFFMPGVGRILGTVKGRSPVAWELRPYERSRFAEHGVSGNSAWERSVPAPPEVDMVAPQTILHNALLAQR
jgi:hypothetical protein